MQPKRMPRPLSAPWAITDEAFERVIAIASRDEFFAEARERALQARDGTPLDNTRSVEMRGPVAIIPIDGPLFRKASLLTDVSGATSYSTLRKDLAAALDNPQVGAILLEVNSPGGEVDGCTELGAAIRAARGRKPLWAYVGGMMASAAYWLGSACDRIVCSETALIGSIGVKVALIDDSEAEAKEGRRTILIVSDQSPDKSDSPIDEKVIARNKARATELAAIFVRTVAENRGVSEAKVLADFGKGDVLVGASALAAGMVDEVGNDIEAVIAALEQHAAKASSAPVPAATARASNVARGTASNQKPIATAPSAVASTPNLPAPKSALPRSAPMPAIKSPSKKPTASADPMDDKKDDKAAASDMVECADCDGDGTMPDGSKCESCGGSGKVAQAKADDDGGDDGADGGDTKPMGDGDDDDMKAMAKDLGLKPTASLREIRTAMAAATVPVASVDKKVAAAIAEYDGKQRAAADKADKAQRAKVLVAAAVDGGYPGDRAALTEHAMLNFASAQKIAQPYIDKSNALFKRHTSAGSFDGAPRPAAGGIADTKISKHGQFKIYRTGQGFAAESKALARRERISLSEAQDRVREQRPELYEAYLRATE